MRKFLIILLSLSIVLEAKDSMHLQKKVRHPVEITRIAAKFKALKNKNDPKQSRWNSELYKTMNSLKDFNWKNKNAQGVIKLLGTPDSQKGNKNYTNYKSLLKLNSNEEFLLYEWRGMHDFLYFTYSDTDSRIIKCDFWMAYE